MPAGEQGGRSRSTLARRLQLFLALLAPLPVALLLTAAIEQYEDRLRLESDRRLAALAKGAGHEIHRRLRNLESDLGMLGASGADARLANALRDRFRSVVWVAPAPDGSPAAPPGFASLSGSELDRLQQGRAVLRIETEPEDRSSLWLTGAPDPAASKRLWAELETSWLWPAEGMPEETGFSWLMLESTSSLLLAHSPSAPAELLLASRELGLESSGGLSWSDGSANRQRARYWTLPLGYDFGVPGLLVLVSEPDVLSPALTTLRRTLLLIAVGAVLFTGLLTLRRLRVEFEPLSALIRAHHRVAEGDLSARFEARGSDEFARLGVAFNEMAEQLQRQFHLLDANQDVATAALANQATEEEIAAAFAEKVAKLVPGAELIVTLTDRHGRLRRVVPDEEPTLGILPAREAASRLPTALLDGAGWAPLDAADWLPERLWGRRSLWRALRSDERVLGAVGVLEKPGSTLRGIELDVLRGPFEQLALALAHVRSLAQLESTNWGALTALARAVDAKSSWTRGHSERVAEIAVAIAEEMAWPEQEVRLIRRGALLHDVGKIGVPGAILDKPGRLTAEEIAMLRTHVEKGVRIIEPLAAFSDVLPILWQHHERLDGSGYPRGLARGEIHPHAALVAVSDVFEALTAERPYRAAQDPDESLQYLVKLAGVEFELQSVAALQRLRESSPRWPFPLRDLRARSVG